MKRLKITHQEATELLEKFNWNLVDAIIFLERNGKIENKETTTIIEAKPEEQYQEDTKTNKESCGGVGTILAKYLDGIGVNLLKREMKTSSKSERIMKIQ